MKSLENMLRVATGMFLCLAVACFMVCCDADTPEGSGSNQEQKNLPDIVLNIPCPDCSGDGECHSCSGDGTCDHCHGDGTCGSCHGTKVCSICHGTGRDDCFYCDGSGYVRCHICYGSGDCSNCNGLGWKRIAGKSQNCPTCHGSGNCTKCHGSGDLKCSLCNGKGYDYCVCYTGKCVACNGKGTCKYCDGSGHCGECEGSNECSHCHGSGISEEGPEILDFLCSNQRKEWYPESDKSNGTVTFTRKGTVYYKYSSESEEIRCRWNPQYDPAKGILISFDDASVLGPYADGSYCYTIDDIGDDYLLLISYSGKTLYFTTSPGSVPPNPEEPLDNALSGEFSVSATKKVRFSRGNLVATVNASGTPTAWKFATNQYDCLGAGGANKTIGSAAGDVDLFGWSTAATNYGISTSRFPDEYSWDFVDWGKAYCEKNNITPDNTWRTLTTAEWQYLFNTRTVNGGTGADKSYSLNITYGGKMGIVLYPDNYTGSTLSGTVTELPECVVFLPAAGSRDGSSVRHVGDGFYWSSTAYDSLNAYGVYFDSYDVYPGSSHGRDYGYSVRLVTESK